MYDRILIPTDGSPEAEQAISYGIGLARTYDAAVHALFVTDESEYAAVTDAEVREQLRSTGETTGRQATADAVAMAEEVDVTAEHEHRRGTPYEEILDCVEQRGIDLVVMGTHGRSGVGPDLGSTTLRVVRNVDVPALTVRFRDDVDVTNQYDDILVATDGSDGAAVAAEHGIDIAQTYGATVHALYVLDPNTYAHGDVPRSIVGLLKEGGKTALEDIADLASERGVDVETSIRRGRPSQELLDYADDNGVDLVTMGAHGHTSETHLGSTTERVVRTAKQPTLSVR